MMPCCGIVLFTRNLSTTSRNKLKKHKQTQHPPDDFYEEQTFKKALYNKIWRLRGVQDGLEGLQVYKPKKKNTPIRVAKTSNFS